MTTTSSLSATPHNLGLYRLEGFSGSRPALLTLHEWLTGDDDLPAIAISGEQGNGKSTLATATAWNHFHHFNDGIVRVSAAGANRFRLYDVVRTMDSVFGTELTRSSQERWGISILEQLYRRRRLLIIDKLAGATEAELTTLVDIISHLHESGGQSRILLIERNFHPLIADLVQFQHIHLEGIQEWELEEFIEKRAPTAVKAQALAHIPFLYRLTRGRPLGLRLLIGLLLDFDADELGMLLLNNFDEQGAVHTSDLVAFAVENYAAFHPQVGPLLERLVSAAGGASLTALRELFWADLGTAPELDETLAELQNRGLIEYDLYRQRIVLHPLIRSYLEQNAMMMGEEWERNHAQYYLPFARKYSAMPIARWNEVDVEWGNIYRAADWCSQRVHRLWEQDPWQILQADPSGTEPLALPEQDTTMVADLRLMRNFGIALAHYAFWRHPPGILEWLASGAVATMALSDMRDYAWLQMNIGRQLFFTGKVHEAIGWLERAQRIFDERDQLMDLAYALTDLGTSYRVLNEGRRALTYFRGAFDAVAQLGDQRALATAYMNLGSAQYSLNNPERALQEHRKALRIGLRLEDDQLSASAYNNMGLAMESMERLDEAIAAYTYALEIFRRIDNVIGISTCYNNLGSACYARGDLSEALKWYELDLKLGEKRGTWTDMAATLHNLGHVAIEQNDPQGALSYFEQSRNLYAAFQLEEYMKEEEEMITYIKQTKL
ncbi:MAG TPA: tetratricopeptide repeat protein [Caldilineaceae bacterium]|mgnify:CR=1 FL=1|nr:tetratricopeptide repeat protein [Caldilineaceae bacterium]